MGSDRGGIRSLAATLAAHWDAVEADFTRYYQTDLGRAVKTWSLRKVLGHVIHLPPGSATWREQGLRDPLEVFHEWMVTLLQFQAGKKITTPGLWRDDVVEPVPEPDEPKKVNLRDVSSAEHHAVLRNAGISVE